MDPVAPIYPRPGVRRIERQELGLIGNILDHCCNPDYELPFGTGTADIGGTNDYAFPDREPATQDDIGANPPWLLPESA